MQFVLSLTDEDLDAISERVVEKLSTVIVPSNAPCTEQLLVSARDAAELLAISERTLWSLTAPRGPIACVNAGNRVLYSRETLCEWIQNEESK